MNTISTTRAVERCEQLAIIGPPPPWYRPILLRRWLRLYRAIMVLDIGVGAQMLREVYPKEWAEQMANQPNNTLRSFTRNALADIQAAERERVMRMVPRGERARYVEPVEGDDSSTARGGQR